MTLILKTPTEFREWRKRQQGRIGFVPTMGALHDGHASLLKKARTENDLVVLSIFVNPTQFNDPKDFEKYPITWDADRQLAETMAVDVIFAPTKEDLYPHGYHYRVQENDFSKLMDGAARPGHFDGVLTVVMKLFQIVQPSLAYFGEKDFQQLQLIRGMVADFFMDLKIVPVPTVREKDGLAMSSRNVRLSSAERVQAPLIHKVLTEEKSAESAAAALTKQGFKVDYVEDRDGRRFVAAFLGSTRLIDNVAL